MGDALIARGGLQGDGVGGLLRLEGQVTIGQRGVVFQIAITHHIAVPVSNAVRIADSREAGVDGHVAGPVGGQLRRQVILHVDGALAGRQVVEGNALRQLHGPLDAGHGGAAQLEGIVRAAHGHAGAALGLAVGDGQLGEVHLARHVAHGLDGAGAAGHNARAQAAEIEAVELRVLEHADEHRGHAVHGGAARILQNLHLAQRVVVVHEHDGGAVRQAAHHAQHAAEAVEQGHYDQQPVLLGQLHAVAQELAVVGDVVMGALNHFMLGTEDIIS